MDVRILSETDVSAYYRLRLEGLTLEPRAFGRAAEEYRQESPESVARRVRPTPGSFTLGAFLDGELVGVMTFVREAGVKTRHKAFVLGVYVTPRARGRGVGRALLVELITYARATPGVEQLMLAVSETQAEARRLYERHGFRVFGREPRALKIGDEYVAEDHMVMLLSAGVATGPEYA